MPWQLLGNADDGSKSSVEDYSMRKACCKTLTRRRAGNRTRDVMLHGGFLALFIPSIAFFVVFEQRTTVCKESASYDDTASVSLFNLREIIKKGLK